MKLGDEDLEGTISCPQMSQLFLSLGFVTLKGGEQEQILLAQIWKIVGGDNEGSSFVLLKNVKIIMCCI